MKNVKLYITCLLCMVIRPVFLAPAITDTTPSGDKLTTEAILTNEIVAPTTLAQIIYRVHGGGDNRNKDNNKNNNQSATEESSSLNTREFVSTEVPIGNSLISTTNITSLNARDNDILSTTPPALQSKAEISPSEEPWNTSFSESEEFNDTNNNNLDASYVVPNATANANETGRSFTTSEGNSSNSVKDRVIFVLPGRSSAEVTQQAAGEVSDPPEPGVNQSSPESNNSTEGPTEQLPLHASDITVTYGDIEGREDLSTTSIPLADEEGTQELTSRLFNENKIEETQPSAIKIKNSSLIEDVEFALSHESNVSNSPFVNDLADLVSSISTMNDTELPEQPEPEESSIHQIHPVSSATTEEPLASSSDNSSKKQQEIPETRSSSSSIEPLNDAANSSLDEKSAARDHANATSLDLYPELNSSFNGSTETNEISSSRLEKKSAGVSGTSEKGNIVSTPSSNPNDRSQSDEISDADGYSSPDSVTNEITATSPGNLNEAELVTESLTEINTDPISTATLNSGSSTEQVGTEETTVVEHDVIVGSVVNASRSAEAETPGYTSDEDLKQRNDISTETALTNEIENVTDLSDDIHGTEESTTVSGEELFANTPLEDFINSTTITTLDLTTVASIVGSQGSPPHSLLEIYNRHTPKTSCNHLGQEYATGQHVEQLDPCHFCVCVNGYLDCYWKNCPPPPEGCMELDFDGVCDRSLYLCPIPKKGEPLPFPANSISRLRREANYTQMTCDILGVQYKVGELIGVASDPCMECRCALDSLYCSPKCCFQPVESGQDPSKNSRANDAVWQPVLSHPLKHLRYDFENQYRVK